MPRWISQSTRMLAALACAGCTHGDMTPTGTPGGPAAGPMDRHCMGDGGLRAQPTSQSVCMFMPDMAGPAPDAGDVGTSVYGDTMFGSEADDDDCKYHVKWTSTPIFENYDVTFTVTATRLADGMAPLTGAAPEAEIFLNDTHLPPNTNPKTTESSGGRYTIGPVRFDAPGRWTVRFHFYEVCYDYADESPHGHAAFFVDVP